PEDRPRRQLTPGRVRSLTSPLTVFQHERNRLVNSEGGFPPSKPPRKTGCAGEAGARNGTPIAHPDLDCTRFSDRLLDKGKDLADPLGARSPVATRDRSGPAGTCESHANHRMVLAAQDFRPILSLRRRYLNQGAVDLAKHAELS